MRRLHVIKHYLKYICKLSVYLELNHGHVNSQINPDNQVSARWDSNGVHQEVEFDNVKKPHALLYKCGNMIITSTKESLWNQGPFRFLSSQGCWHLMIAAESWHTAEYSADVTDKNGECYPRKIDS